jgi:hypothetical protein
MSSKELTRRNRYKWNINEIISLEREYELQELNIQEIALLHKRSVFSILNKLEKEKIIVNFNDARGYDKIKFWEDPHDENDEHDEDDEDEIVETGITDDVDYYDKELDFENIPQANSQNIDDIDVVYFEDELIKKVENISNYKKLYENKDLYEIIYELTKRSEYLEERISKIETENKNSLLDLIKKWFYSKQIC